MHWFVVCHGVDYHPAHEVGDLLRLASSHGSNPLAVVLPHFPPSGLTAIPLAFCRLVLVGIDVDQT